MSNKAKEQFKQSLDALRSEKLSDVRKEVLKAQILEKAQLPSTSVTSPYVSSYTLFVKRITVAVLVLVLVGGGTVYASEKSLPGESLYSVKTELIEPFMGNLKSEDKQREYQLALADKRLQELEILIENDAAKEEHVQDHFVLFQEHIALADVYVREQEEANAVAVMQDVAYDGADSVSVERVEESHDVAESAPQVSMLMQKSPTGGGEVNEQSIRHSQVLINPLIERYGELVAEVPELDDFYANNFDHLQERVFVEKEHPEVSPMATEEEEGTATAASEPDRNSLDVPEEVSEIQPQEES